VSGHPAIIDLGTMEPTTVQAALARKDQQIAALRQQLAAAGQELSAAQEQAAAAEKTIRDWWQWHRTSCLGPPQTSPLRVPGHLVGRVRPHGAR
jgi:hypothetical protein